MTAMLNDDSIEYLRGKVMIDIIGNCCSISNSMTLIKFDINKSKEFNKLKFLIKNFSNIVNIQTVVDDFYNNPKNESHWNTKLNREEFKSYITQALESTRDEKLNELV